MSAPEEPVPEAEVPSCTAAAASAALPLDELPPRTGRASRLYSFASTDIDADAAGAAAAALLPCRGAARPDGTVHHVVLLMGPPASGKSTLGRRLAQRMKFVHVDVGEALRKMGPLNMRALEDAAVQVVGSALNCTPQSDQMFLVNGFPRAVDGMSQWTNRWPNTRISFALVLDAPDDILRARASARCKAGERPDDNDAGFEDRLRRYREVTAALVAEIAFSGQARFVNAAASADWVEEAAVVHFRPTVAFVVGRHADLPPELCESAAEQANALYIDAGQLFAPRREEDGPTPGAVAVARVREALASAACAGALCVLSGFPRHAEDADKWLAQPDCWPQAICAVHVFRRQPGAACLGCSDFVSGLRRLCPVQCLDANAAPTAGLLALQLSRAVRAAQPPSVAAAVEAATLLMDWMSAAKCTCWWNVSADASVEYRKQIAVSDVSYKSALSTPRACPPPEAWLVWLAHMLRTEAYNAWTTAHLPRHRPVGPLPPPSCAHVVRAPPERQPAPPQLPPESVGPKEVAASPGAFADALGAFASAGLRCFGDPRAFEKPTGHLMALLDVLGLHYRQFMLALVWEGPGGRSSPPPELDWIWHAHIIHPIAYADDCRRLFGREIPHRPGAPPKGSAVAPADDGFRPVEDVKEGLQASLTRLAFSDALAEVLQAVPPLSSVDDSILILGCILPGGDRVWLREHLEDAGMEVSAALARVKQHGYRRKPETSSESLTPDPSTMEVSVRTLGGEVALQRRLRRDTSVLELKALLGQPSDVLVKLYLSGRELQDADRLEGIGFMPGDVINLIRQAKPPSPPPVYHYRAPSSPRSTPPSPRSCCSCFTSDCTVWVKNQADSQEEARQFARLKHGDFVRTGPPGQYRRVTRIWPTPVGGVVETVEVSPGCRLTTGHPVLSGGRWRRPETLAKPRPTFEDVVYTLEVEGHEDTVLVGETICAALGVYCGEDFGWNLFTRKSTFCDRPSCDKCAKAVVHGVDFSTVDESMMAARYEPY